MTKTAKNHTLWVAHTYIAHMRETFPPLQELPEAEALAHYQPEGMTIFPLNRESRPP